MNFSYINLFIKKLQLLKLSKIVKHTHALLHGANYKTSNTALTDAS